MKILITDDSKVNRRVLGKYVGEDEHDIVYATNGQEALQIYQESNPDLIIMDVEMPGLSGYAVAKKLREMRPSEDHWVPIIFLSARIDDESIERGIESGGDDYLVKPISATVLRAKIFAMQRIANMRRRLMTVLKEFTTVNDQLIQANKILEELSVKDPLTKLGNRRAFETMIEKECQSARRTEGWLTVMMVDVDKFKQFNDKFGHQSGDKALEVVSKAMSESLPRVTDMVARYGGEEFAVILPQTDDMGAQIVAERLRKSISEALIPISDSKNVQVTASIGIYSTKQDEELSSDNMVEKADMALYQSKQDGRDRYTLYQNYI
jgi:diguanylate cyclase (GGDEF)-like protein